MPKGEPIIVTPEKIFGANPKQFEAWTKSWEHQFLLYGGAAGGGKSFFLRWWCVFYLMALAKLNNVPRAVVGLFCEDYPSLEDRHISKIRTEFPPSLGTFKESKSPQFTLRPEYGSGRILLRNLDDSIQISLYGVRRGSGG
jgi:hypothetical protein